MFADVHIYLGVALAGLVSFLSPCVLPLVPPYLIYLGGSSMEQMTDDGGVAQDVWLRTVLASVFFVLGFTTVFVLLGAGASAFGQLIGQYKAELAIASGFVIIAFGLHFLGVFKIGFLHLEARYHHQTSGTSLAGAYLIGLAFAFGWTPCVGPILATVLAVATREDSLAAGVKLLLAYSLGLGIPFVLAAVAIRPFLGFMQKFRRHLGKVEKAMGALLVMTGLLFVTGSMNGLGNWMLETFPGLAKVEETFTPKSLQGEIMKQSGPK